MNKLFTKASLVTSAVVTVSTLTLSLLLSAPKAEAVDCPQLKTNDLFKVSGYSAVYLVNTNGKRLYFPNAEVYSTWFSDFSTVKTIDPVCIDNYPSGGGVNYRPGSRLVKGLISPSVYAVGPNNTKHKITNEATAMILFGNDWATKVRYLSDAFDANLTVGPDVEDVKLVNGQLVRIDEDPQVYFVSEGKLKKVIGNLPYILSKDVQPARQARLETTPISGETITPAEILADPSQGGVKFANENITTPVVTPTQPTEVINPQSLETGGNYVDVVSCKQIGKDIEIKRSSNDSATTLTSSCRDAGYGLREYSMTCSSATRYYVSWKPCSSTPVQQTPVQTVNQTDLISQFWVNEDLSTDRLMTAISYGSVSYPWYPAEATIAQNVNNLHIIVTPKVTSNLSYGFIWLENGATKVDFTDTATKNSAKIVNFNSSPRSTLQLTDYYRGKWVFIQVFVRNNDGVSGVPGMPVEVDDIAVARVYVPAKATAPVVTGPNLSLMPLFVTPGTNQVLTNYPRTAEISFGTLVDARHYEVEVYCDYCGSSLWSGSPYKYTVLQPSSGYAKVTTDALAGDNKFRTRVRAVYVDKVTGNYLYGAWTDYRYFSYDTRSSATINQTVEVSLSDLKAMNPQTINFEDATGTILDKYLGTYNVTFTANKGKAIYVNTYNRGGAITASGEYSLFNDATYPNTSVNEPLLVNFSTPVKAFGFYLGNGDKNGQQVNATITVYGSRGAVIGTFKKNAISQPVTTYFGVSSNQPITSVMIDYGATSLGEELDDVMIVR